MFISRVLNIFPFKACPWVFSKRHFPEKVPQRVMSYGLAFSDSPIVTSVTPGKCLQL
jgi:hypothetical protein